MEKKVTFVTGLWDIGRSELISFKRNFDDYLRCFEVLLSLDINLIIYAPEYLHDFIIQRRSLLKTHIITRNNEDFKTCFDFYDRVNQIRNSPEWYSQADWLSQSPQAKLDLYGPITMSKMFMVNDSTIHDPFGSDYFFWIDAGLSNTVSKEWLSNLTKISSFMQDKKDKMVFITYPYDSNTEIHGFKRKPLADYCGTDFVNYVPRGGFFGGSKSAISELNGNYYSYLSQSLHDGYLGTEESIFCILCYRNPKKIYRFIIEGNGLVYPFFQALGEYPDDPVVSSNVYNKPRFDKVRTALYILTFNSPEQVKCLLESFQETDPNFLTKPSLYLINNSTDLSTTTEYERLCKLYGMEHIKKSNIGVCGGRHFVAEHFDSGNDDYYIFFEDDMFLVPEKDQGTCKSGYATYAKDLYLNTLKIMYLEDFDYLKLSYSEFFGTNTKQWAWFNVGEKARGIYFPDHPMTETDETLCPETLVFKTDLLNNIGYKQGEFHYCNWPLWFNKAGNYKLFLEKPLKYPYEQTWMSLCYQLMRDDQIRAAVLELSPIHHNRFQHYPKEDRKEN